MMSLLDLEATLFGAPFYYIEYGIPTWRLAIMDDSTDDPDKVLEDYANAMKLEYTYASTFESADIKLSFDKEHVEILYKFCQEALSNFV